MVVVIVSCNRERLLRRTLRSIAANDIPESLSEIMVVESGSKCGVEELLRDSYFGIDLRYMHEPSGKKTAALNRALKAQPMQFIVFLDDDVRLSKGLLSAYDRVSKSGPGRYFGGPVSCDYVLPPPEWIVEFLPPSAKGYPAEHEKEHIQWFLGFNWAAFQQDLELVGGFEERIGPGTRVVGGDETLMQFNLRTMGCEPVFVPDARVWHWVPPERCSAEWTLKRAASNGYMTGVIAAFHRSKENIPWSFCKEFVKMIRRQSRKVDKREILRFTKQGRWELSFVKLFAQSFVAGFVDQFRSPIYRSHKQ